MDHSSYPPAAQEAFRVAVETFGKMDVQDTCSRTGATYDSERRQYVLPCLGSAARIGAEDCSLEWEYKEKAVFHLTLLHYLMHADGSVPREEWIALREMTPAGSNWVKRLIDGSVPPLVEAFGEETDAFFGAAAKVGGEKISRDTVKFFILPHIPVQITLWPKDEEFPADARILFDKTVRGQLPSEDLMCIAEIAVHALLRAAGKVDALSDRAVDAKLPAEW